MEITEDDIFKISKSSNEESIEIIKECVEYEYKTLSELMQYDLYFDALLDEIKFTVEKGFALNECVFLVKLYKRFLDFLKQNPSVQLKDYFVFVGKALSVYANNFNEHKLKLIADYYNETIFQHFELYKYVLTNEKNIVYIENNLDVECPPEESDKLKDAKPFHIWEYEDKLKPLMAKESNLDNHYLNERIKLNQEEESVKKNVTKYVKETNEDGEDELNEEKISQLVEKISFPLVNAATNIIKNEINESKEKLLVNVEKRSVARPEELGPLPPFELNSSVKTVPALSNLGSNTKDTGNQSKSISEKPKTPKGSLKSASSKTKK